MKISYSPEFERRYRRLPLEAKRKAESKEEIFRQNPFDPRLKTHKLHGRLGNYWAFSVDHMYRIVFLFEKEGVRFSAVGDHSLYKKFT
ncbi:type II toxin-antitoxin system mRNA interferase toxin, RelE/StbE family [Patescibacteria group bacterium]|nr:type II toxin-antitoxin system mRNA interferase toxin, RelE/StbE family [Patescibacteria group bacterium]